MSDFLDELVEAGSGKLHDLSMAADILTPNPIGLFMDAKANFDKPKESREELHEEERATKDVGNSQEYRDSGVGDVYEAAKKIPGFGGLVALPEAAASFGHGARKMETTAGEIFQGLFD
jgi:hypothetical protein